MKDGLCECGKQITPHMLHCIRCSSIWTEEDLMLARENAIEVSQFGANDI